jgi:hypothetical protein
MNLIDPHLRSQAFRNRRLEAAPRWHLGRDHPWVAQRTQS